MTASTRIWKTAACLGSTGNIDTEIWALKPCGCKIDKSHSACGEGNSAFLYSWEVFLMAHRIICDFITEIYFITKSYGSFSEKILVIFAQNFRGFCRIFALKSFILVWNSAKLKHWRFKLNTLLVLFVTVTHPSLLHSGRELKIHTLARHTLNLVWALYSVVRFHLSFLTCSFPWRVVTQKSRWEGSVHTFALGWSHHSSFALTVPLCWGLPWDLFLAKPFLFGSLTLAKHFFPRKPTSGWTSVGRDSTLIIFKSCH